MVIWRRFLRAAIAATAVINLVVYGVVVLGALLYHLLVGKAAPVFWGYVIVNALFLVPIGAI